MLFKFTIKKTIKGAINVIGSILLEMFGAGLLMLMYTYIVLLFHLSGN